MAKGLTLDDLEVIMFFEIEGLERIELGWDRGIINSWTWLGTLWWISSNLDQLFYETYS